MPRLVRPWVEGRPTEPIRHRKSRWPGEGSLIIENVVLLGEDGRERAVFRNGASLRMRIRFRARTPGTFDVIPAAVLYRLDGVLVCRYVAEKAVVSMAEGETRAVYLDIQPLKLGNGYYVFSVGLYRVLDPFDIDAARVYDLLDRSYEFGVEGTPPLLDGVFLEPGRWTFEGQIEAHGPAATVEALPK